MSTHNIYFCGEIKKKKKNKKKKKKNKKKKERKKEKKDYLGNSHVCSYIIHDNCTE